MHAHLVCIVSVSMHLVRLQDTSGIENIELTSIQFSFELLLNTDLDHSNPPFHKTEI